MSAELIDGQVIAARIRRQAAEQAGDLRTQGVQVRLDAIMVGDPAAGAIYARSQETRCHEAGIAYRLHTLPADVSAAEIRAKIQELNEDSQVTGIMLNMPVPEPIDAPAMQYCIDPYKDVEGVNPANIGLLFYDSPIIAPCTALAVMEVLKEARCEPRGLDAVVVGQGAIAGRPVGLFLLHKFATVTGCHVATRDLAAHTRQADVLVVAVGRPELIGSEHVKPGALVIDVGINRVIDSATGEKRTVGDVKFDEVKEVAAAITPVPGGVGPVTVAILLRSAVEAARKQLGQRRIVSAV